MTKTIRLLATAMIAGLPRSPVEGLQTVTEEDAERLIEAGQAEYAYGDFETEGSEGSEGDGLDDKTKTQLLDVAKAEEVDLAKSATKAEIIEAIRAKRSPEGDDLDGMTREQLFEVATNEAAAFETDANRDALLASIRSKRAETAAA